MTRPERASRVSVLAAPTRRRGAPLSSEKLTFSRRGKAGFATEELRDKLFGAEILLFRYESVRLARLDAEEYLDRGGCVAAALAALMNRSARSRRRTLEALRVSMVLEVVKSALDEDKQGLLVDLIKMYFRAEKLERKGLEQGREEGVLAGMRETLLRLLTAKFGPLAESTTKSVQTIESVDELDELLERVLTATSLEEMKL